MNFLCHITRSAIDARINGIRNRGCDLVKGTRRCLFECLIEHCPQQRLERFQQKAQQPLQRSIFHIIDDWINNGISEGLHRQPSGRIFKLGVNVSLHIRDHVRQ